MSPPPTSHHCELPLRGLVRILARPVVGVAILVGLLQAGAYLEILPAPVPADIDRTILAAKADLARRGDAATVLLAGDSSCLMDVDARELGHRLGAPVLNLGTLSYLDLVSHGELVSAFARHHPGHPSQVVLLLHPEALRRPEPVPAYAAFLRARLAETRSSTGAGGTRAGGDWKPADWLGGSLLRERLLQPAVPPLLPADFGPTYGSARNLAREMAERRGSLLDPTRFDPTAERGSAEYRLAPGLEEASGVFRAAVPASARLAVGLTPVPASLAASRHEAQARGLLTTWAGWLRADQVLTNLPAILPDDRFATLTHLNRRGVTEYTGRLAAALSRGEAR